RGVGMPKLADPASHGPHRPDLVSDALWLELRSRAHERRTEIFECLRQKVRRPPDAALEQVTLAAGRYRWFARLYGGAPTRRVLHDRLSALGQAVSTASALLNSRDTWLMAALSLGGLRDKEARALSSGSASKLEMALGDLGQAVETALETLQLTG